MFSSILAYTESGLSVTSVALCLAAALVSGLILSLIYKKCENPTGSFLVTVAILPMIVMLVILMVNGNLGTGVAVAGSFSLVRFRSLPGKASDILIVFIAMGLGLAAGMGYALLAVCASVMFALVYALLSSASLLKPDESYRSLRITIPEDLDYTAIFDDIFSRYTSSAVQQSAKTVNLGTMFQVTYDIRLKDPAGEKQMIDEIRVRSGNLPVISSRTAAETGQL